MTSFLVHPRIAPDTVEERRYQSAMADCCLKHDTLIILPTGLGKTVVALMVAAEVLEKGKKVLLMAPTKPLVDQHSSTFDSWLRNTEIGVMNGNMDPRRRTRLVQNSDMVISTPQAIANDLENGLYDLRDFGLVIYDEAHRGVGNYAYVTVAKYNSNSISMGMTASPGSDENKVIEMCQKLCFTRIEMRSDYDPDVSPYIHDTQIGRVEVNLPAELLDVVSKLTRLFDGYIRDLTNMGLMYPNRPPTMSHLLQVGNELQVRLRNNDKSTYVYRGLVSQTIAVKLSHAISLAQTQGMSSLRNYLMKLCAEAESASASKSSKELVSVPLFKEVLKTVEESRIEHPKISRVMSLVSMKLNESERSKVMVFAQYRDTCDLLVEKLSLIKGAVVGKLIGQSKGGLKQKEQLELLEKFRNGNINIIVSTSVGEEGLDISSTDLVIFYEPVPSEIRTIQRRGRTGRKSDGEVIVLVAKNTMDETFENTSAKKEEQMRAKLVRLNVMLAKSVTKPIERGQMLLSKY